jgi:hypothetical protein
LPKGGIFEYEYPVSEQVYWKGNPDTFNLVKEIGPSYPRG